jgi:hypothetical protein
MSPDIVHFECVCRGHISIHKKKIMRRCVGRVSKFIRECCILTNIHNINDQWQMLTLMFLPGTLLTSCSAMSSQISGSSPEFRISASFSQSRLAMWAYVPDGDACVILVVVTTPVDLPASLSTKTEVPSIKHHLTITNIKLVLQNFCKTKNKWQARSSVIGWGTMLKAGRSRFRYPMRSLDFLIYLTLIGHGVVSASNRNKYQEYSCGKWRPTRKADNLTATSQPIF